MADDTDPDSDADAQSPSDADVDSDAEFDVDVDADPDAESDLDPEELTILLVEGWDSDSGEDGPVSTVDDSPDERGESDGDEGDGDEGVPDDTDLPAGTDLDAAGLDVDAVDPRFVSALDARTVRVGVDEAFERIADDRPDWVIVDVGAHDSATKWRQFVAEIQERHPDQPYLVVGTNVSGALSEVDWDEWERVVDLHEATQLFVGATDRRDVADITVHAARDILGFPVNGVRLLNEDGTELEPVSIDSPRVELAGEIPVYAVDGDSPPAVALREGESLVYDDVRDHDDDVDRGDLRATMYLPLGEFGTLSVGTTRVGAFDDHDRLLAELLTANAAIALERIDREARLRDERDRLAALFEHSSDAIARCAYADGVATVEAVNPAFSATFGCDPDAVAGRAIDDVVLGTDDTDDGPAVGAVLGRAGGGPDGPTESVVRRRTTDGVAEFLRRVVPIPGVTGHTALYVVYTDISDQRERENRIRVLNRVLRHDLRTEMNLVFARLDALRDRIDDDDGIVDDLETIAHDLVSRSEYAREVESMLGRRGDSPGEVDVAAELRAAATDAEAREDVSLSGPASCRAVADPAIRIALREVLTNAVDHTPPDTPIRASVECDDDWVTVRVADDGPGIPDQEHAPLAGELETPLDHGSGLGLWLVRWAVEASGGTVSFDTEGGTTVEMRLRAAE